MKIIDAIVKADELRKNKFSEEQKYGWLMELEDEVCELMKKTKPQNTFPNTETELFMPFPNDNIYPLYLICAIDYYNGETDLYQNDLTIYKDAKQKAFSWYRRKNTPSVGKGFKVM